MLNIYPSSSRDALSKTPTSLPHATTTIAYMAVSGNVSPGVVLIGDLVANEYKTALSIIGGGVVSFLSLSPNAGYFTRKLGFRITMDGVVVAERTPVTVPSGQGFVPIGMTSTASAAPIITTVLTPFKSSLLIEVMSDTTGIGESTVGMICNYRVV